MFTEPFDVKLGEYTMNLSGSTGLDQSIAYAGKVKLPASAGSLGQLSTLDLKIGGTFTSPKVSIDTKSMAKQAAESVKDKAIDKLGEKLGTRLGHTCQYGYVEEKSNREGHREGIGLLEKENKIMLLKLYEKNNNPNDLQRIVDVLNDGGLIIYPTDTMYAIGCHGLKERAIERICRIKDIDAKKNHLSIICYDMSSISEYAKLDNNTFKLMKKKPARPVYI